MDWYLLLIAVIIIGAIVYMRMTRSEGCCGGRRLPFTYVGAWPTCVDHMPTYVDYMPTPLRFLPPRPLIIIGDSPAPFRP